MKYLVRVTQHDHAQGQTFVTDHPADDFGTADTIASQIRQTMPTAMVELIGKGIPSSPDANANSSRYGAGSEGCVVCARPVNVKAKGTKWVHVCDGGDALRINHRNPKSDAQGECEDNGCCGLQPVGSDCYKRHMELWPFRIDYQGELHGSR